MLAMSILKGFIYKIESTLTDKIYIGSTTKKIEYRLTQHKYDYKRFIDGRFHNISSFEIIKLGNANITLIEECDFNSIVELQTRERFHIELNKDKCINKCLPTRTIKEWSREYYQKNKEKAKEYQKQYYYRNRCCSKS
jgi:hypothetical protein